MEKKKQREKNRGEEQKALTKNFEEIGKETRELHQKYEKLEQDWNTFKESRSTPSRKYRSPLNTIITNPIFQQLDITSNSFISPKELMFSLQRESSSPSSSSSSEEEGTWMNYDAAAAKEKTIERGKLKGRILFESSESDDSDSNMVSQREVRSKSFCYSEPLSSSLSHPIDDFVDKDMVANVADRRVGSYKSRFVNGKNVFLLGFVVLVLLVVAIFMSYGGDYFDVSLVPT